MVKMPRIRLAHRGGRIFGCYAPYAPIPHHRPASSLTSTAVTVFNTVAAASAVVVAYFGAGPVGPVTPVDPGTPVGPVGPVAPTGPPGPVGPIGPSPRSNAKTSPEKLSGVTIPTSLPHSKAVLEPGSAQNAQMLGWKSVDSLAGVPKRLVQWPEFCAVPARPS